MHLAEISLARPVQSSLHVKHKFEFIFLFQLVLCPEIRLFNLIENNTRIINSCINHFASSWIDLKLKVIKRLPLKNDGGIFFSSPGFEPLFPETEASVLPIIYPDSLLHESWRILFAHLYAQKSVPSMLVGIWMTN